jgi:hypothetical protein
MGSHGTFWSQLAAAQEGGLQKRQAGVEERDEVLGWGPRELSAAGLVTVRIMVKERPGCQGEVALLEASPSLCKAPGLHLRSASSLP